MSNDKNGELRFLRIEAVDNESLDIELSNSVFLTLPPKMILDLPGFAELAEDDRIFYPKTDGNTIYWRDGPRPIGIDEFLALIGKTGGENK